MMGIWIRKFTRKGPQQKPPRKSQLKHQLTKFFLDGPWIFCYLISKWMIVVIFMGYKPVENTTNRVKFPMAHLSLP